MLTKLHGIVLQCIRHNDSTDIVSLYTEQRGRVALLVRMGSSRSARLRRVRLSPLAIVATEVNFRESRELQFSGEIASPYPWRNLYFDPMKSSMTIFIGEFLNRLLRESDSDPAMWRFLVNAIHSLDTLQRGMANYHLAFLIRLLHFCGIEPDMSTWQADRYFDMRAGTLTDMPPLHRDVLLPEDVRHLPVLMRMNFRNLHLFRLNVDQRRRLLNILLHYYSLHLPVGDDLRSVDVLRTLFS